MVGLLVSVFLFATLVAAISYYGYRHYARPGRIIEQVGPAAAALENATEWREEGRPGLLLRTVRIIGEKVPLSPNEASMTRRNLMAAGYRSGTALVTFYGIKVVLGAGLLVAGFLLRDYVTSVALLKLLVVAGGGLAGYFGPNLALDHLVARRMERIRYALPDALDLLVVCVEAGLALDQAMQNVARELKITHTDICDEFELVNLEMRAGKRRADALRNLAERAGEAELRNLVSVLIQTDRFGTSMAESLRTHSDFLRVQRKQDAEERANKVGVKLIFPIFFFILPAMFLVTGGPAILQLVKQLMPLMRSLQLQ